MQKATLRKYRVILLVAMLFVLRVSVSAQPKAEVLGRWKAEDLRIASLPDWLGFGAR